MSGKRGPWIDRRGQANLAVAIDQVIDLRPRPGEQIQHIPDGQLEDSPYQARQSFSDEHIEDLAQGMSDAGFQGVLIVRPLVAWHDRLAPYPAGYPTALQPVSLCLSATGIRFSGRPVPTVAFGFPCGRLTGLADHSGVSTFRIGEVQPGRALPLLRGLGILNDGGNEPSSLTHPPRKPSTAVIDDEALEGVHLRSPFRSFSRLWRHDGWALLGFFLGFAPRRYQRCTPG